MNENGAYDVRYDRKANVLFYSMSGFWTMETIAGFVTDLKAVVATIGRTPLRFDTLSDATNFPVQSGEVSAALGQIMTAARAIRTGRTAIAVASMLNKLQAERTMMEPDVRIFLSLDDARAWLTAPETEQR